MTILRRLSSVVIALVVMSAVSTATYADVVAVVSAKSTITSLNAAQIADIFLGKISHFPNGSHATPIDQVEGSTARETFYTRFAGKSAAQMKAYWSKIIFTGRGQPPMAVDGSAEMKRRISGDPNAIGYINQDQLDDSVRAVLSAPGDRQ